MIARKNNLVMGIYFHPEAYPPTLNAIGELSECFDQITVVHRPHLKTEWNYPGNVKAVPSGTPISSQEQELAPLSQKVSFFLTFVFSLFNACRRSQPSMILLYDSISLFAYSLVRPFIGKRHRLWYHNHDVTEWALLRKFSIGWFAARAEAKMFRHLDIFSLPSNERKQYFPMEQFKGKYFFVPNYPARKFYNQFYSPKSLTTPLKLVFQGSIGPYHGIEEIIPLLKETLAGYSLELVLKGPCRQEYKERCLRMASEHGVSDKLEFVGVTRYEEVPRVASTCHIGIGILARKDIMNTTLGTASNKLYEYAAVGLPVLYYDSTDFVPFLKAYPWALPTVLNSSSIRQAILTIIADYDFLSRQAHEDFQKKLNFESGFSELKHYLKVINQPQSSAVLNEA